MSILSWELVKLLTSLMHKFLELSIFQLLVFGCSKDSLVIAAKLSDNNLRVLAHLDSLIDAHANIFDGPCLQPEGLQFFFSQSTSLASPNISCRIEHLIELSLFLSELHLQASQLLFDHDLFLNVCLVVNRFSTTQMRLHLLVFLLSFELILLLKVAVLK